MVFKMAQTFFYCPKETAVVFLNIKPSGSSTDYSDAPLSLMIQSCLMFHNLEVILDMALRQHL